MSKNKILILKNDRAGDLFTSLPLISSLINPKNTIKIYLSELNIGFSFFFKKLKVQLVKFDLSFIQKINIFLDIYNNKYKTIYILSPKSFYFLLPLFFRNIKFYAIVYNSDKNLRPSSFLRKFLYKYEILYRNTLNKNNYQNIQTKLIDNEDFIDKNYSNINIPIINSKLKELLPDKFLLFQFRYHFFEELGWSINEFDILIKNILTKYDFVLFSSDIENNTKSKFYNDYFLKDYSIIDTTNFKKYINNNNKNVFYLKDINSINLFHLLNESEINLAKHGIFTHISFFHKKKSHNLFNFKINTKEDIIHQKISFSEWYKGMNLNFSFLNNDLKKASKKILKNI